MTIGFHGHPPLPALTKILPVLIVVTAAATSVCGAVTGCSGAEDQDVLAASSSNATTTSSSGTTSSGTTGGTSGATSGGTTSGTPSDCTQEVEPNDDKDSPNELNPSRCGTLTNRDYKDILTFRLKPATKTMQINFSGRVRLKVDVPGRDTTELTPDNAGVVPFVMGVDYIIEVTPLSNSNADLPWRVTVVEK